ncbi:PREDICTED: antigen WC1.1-like [Condylura cristata]|uniref:antigen WC1.1-like n=1 Tax=Condylura cristata TaxID=143302 RepID=UPI0006438463|nr:PREDICTED: antigen WC1.1-like [Condylura cristata]
MALLGHLFLQGLCFLHLSAVVGAQALELRLVNGGHHCEGRVEMKYQGTWSTLLDEYWRLEEATVVCRQLGCGAAVSALKGAPFGPGHGLVWYGYLHCSGTELTLNGCSHSKFQDYRNKASHSRDAGVVCSGFVRLAGGDEPCSGQVEVHSRGVWTPVSDGNFTSLTAQVICAELGCGKAVAVLGGVPLRESDRGVWPEEFWCEGQEQRLWLCPRVPCAGGTCHHRGAVRLACSVYTEVRLMNSGSSRCEGRVEMRISGRWSALCASHWSLANAHVVCRQLGCGVALSTRNHTQRLSLCTHSQSPPAGSKEGAGKCSGLVGGGHPCAGRVEILRQGSWGTVCDDGWDLRDAHVVCRQLGCGEALNATVSAHFGEGTGPIWLEELGCTGNESHVWKCPSRGWESHDCRHKEDAGVICSDSPQLRLVDGGHRCAGRVEILHRGSWGTVCDYKWDLPDAHVVCKQLGCGEALRAMASAQFGLGSGPIWLDNLQCTGTESHVWKCQSRGWGKHYCSHGKDAGVICSGFVRLAGGDEPCSGRVEVHSGGDWTPVSDGNFTLLTAQVICAELWCGKAAYVREGVSLRESDGRVWPEEFWCEGREQGLWFCPRVTCPGGTCHHRGAVHLVCSEYTEVRLMNSSSSRCEGQVEIHISGRWTALCAFHWSLANAHVVCRQLGCGVALSTPEGAHSGGAAALVLKARFHCLGNESSLWTCPVTALGAPDCGPGHTASVTCSGNQTQELPQCTQNLLISTASQEGAPNCSDNPQLRLVGGGHRCAGRVEILHQGSWGTVCDDGWDLRDAHVVCRQLGCGEALNATVSAHFGVGSGPIWLEELRCTGNESQLWKCPSLSWGHHDCRHKEDAGVICSEFSALRLVSEHQDCAGWLEVFYNGTWGGVCNSPMDTVTLSVICRQLGCGDSGTLNPLVAAREGSRPRWVDGIRCRKTDTSLWQCPSDPWKYHSCSSREEASVTCAEKRPKSCPSAAPCTDREKLRLRGGDGACSGRVEVWHAGAWGTVCDDSWSLAEAHVVCRQLGCGSALDAPRAAAFGAGNGSIWLDEVRCRGGEPSLWACPAAPWGQSDCKHEEDAGVRCSGAQTSLKPHHPLLSSGSRSDPAAGPGIFSLPGVLCIILGALLFLVLVILGIQLHGGRAEHRASPAFEDVIDEALYQEIDHYALPEKDLYYSPEPPGHHASATGDCYDDVEEFRVPREIPSSPGMSGNYTFPEEEGDSQPGNQTQGLPLCTHSPSTPAVSAASEEGAANCSDSPQLRLVGGGHRCAGRVEILHQGSWGTVCDGGWDLRDAHVNQGQYG